MRTTLLYQCLSLAIAAAAFSPTVHHASNPSVQYHNNNRLQKNNIILPAAQREDEEPSSVVRERIKNGNYLDLLQISVVIFFLFTVWLSALSDYSSNTFNNPEFNGSGKSRVYKYIDADKLLRDEFEREESKVIFD